MDMKIVDPKIKQENEGVVADFAKVMGITSNHELERFPKRIAIEVTSTCNARCVMCPIEEWERSVNFMPDDIFNKIVEDMRPHVDWIEEVSLHIDGEPLMDKKLEAKLIVMKEMGIKSVMITSNAGLMWEHRSESLLKAGLDRVDFSIDGATKETFEAIRLRLNFEECVTNIENFLKVRDRLGKTDDVHVTIRMTVSETNCDEYEDFKAYWKPLLGKNDRVYGKLLHNWGAWAEEFAPGSGIDKTALNNRACPSPWVNFNIFTDGRVPLCCVDFNADLEMGNVVDNTIQEIWQNPVSRNARQQMLEQGRNWSAKCVDCLAWDQTLKLS
ncbi:radical SAM protein [bacterium SCSIO 12827]|nr:radical SAM protein [bacterium SCSIO 12827]